MKIRSLISIIVWFSIAGPGHAAQTTYNGYTLNTETHIVSDGNLEWLQWSVTENMTINEVMEDIAGNYAGGGWRVASNLQMSNLFNAFAFCPFQFDSDEKTSQNCDDPVTHGYDAPDDPQRNFVRLFGRTYTDLTIYDDSPDPHTYSGAIFGEDLDNNGRFNRAAVLDDYLRPPLTNENEGFAFISDDPSYTADTRGNPYGVALVRTANTTVATTDVPVPSYVLVWLSIGLIWLSSRQIKRYPRTGDSA